MNVATDILSRFKFDNSFARSLDGFFVPWQATQVTSPKLWLLNHDLARELGLDPAELESDIGTAIFSGNVAPPGSTPLAQAYAGHQFGGFSAKLGDGRALLLGEVIDTNGRRRDIQLKGSGPTPFSRNGDGKAALGPVLREYLIGEAMYALGVPTTRALAAVTTGETIRRETALPGAVLTRVAASHIRVGTFQYFAARGEADRIRQLADYVIARHYPDARNAENPYLSFFEAVVDAQASLVARWMSVGFIHGVMNTDNMTISGETIDYGPCAFMDAYAPDTVFSSIDSHGRYAYVNQPPIAKWNLARLAETLIPLIDGNTERSIEILTEAINAFSDKYNGYWIAAMRAKLGLTTQQDDDWELVNDLLSVMEEAGADFTGTFRRLSGAARGDEAPVVDAIAFKSWMRRWRARLQQEGRAPETVAAGMDRINPIYIPRNHKVEEALSAAVEREDMTPFAHLLKLVSHPFDEIDGNETFTQPAPTSPIPYQTFCGT